MITQAWRRPVTSCVAFAVSVTSRGNDAASGPTRNDALVSPARHTAFDGAPAAEIAAGADADEREFGPHCLRELAHLPPAVASRELSTVSPAPSGTVDGNATRVCEAGAELLKGQSRRRARGCGSGPTERALCMYALRMCVGIAGRTHGQRKRTRCDGESANTDLHAATLPVVLVTYGGGVSLIAQGSGVIAPSHGFIGAAGKPIQREYRENARIAQNVFLFA